MKLNLSRLKKLSKGFQWLEEKVSPSPPVGGIEITDSILHFAKWQDGKVFKSSLRLPPGIVESGQLKDKGKLTTALGELYRKVSPDRRKTESVILTVLPNNVYIQTITLPFLGSGNLSEAAELNLQMVSPLPIAQSYYDWQRIDAGLTQAQQTEILAAFIPQSIIDGFTECLGEAGFNVVAAEFTSLSLIRELKRQKLIEAEKSYLVVEIRAEGIIFILIRGNQLVFHSFYPWSALGKESKTIRVADLETTLADEVNTILNFFSTHWGSQISNLIAITSEFQNEIKETLTKRLPGLVITFFSPQETAGVVGAAYRGLTPRPDDQDISLSNLSALEVFEQTQALNFVSFWRNIFFTVSGFLLLLTLGSDLFLRQFAEETSHLNSLNLNQRDVTELLSFQNKAKEFNQLVALAREAHSKNLQLGPTVELINSLTGPEIEINRFYLQSSEGPISINGRALNEQAAISFKNRISERSEFKEVELPLSQISQETGGRITFSLRFKVASLNHSK